MNHWSGNSFVQRLARFPSRASKPSRYAFVAQTALSLVLALATVCQTSNARRGQPGRLSPGLEHRTAPALQAPALLPDDAWRLELESVRLEEAAASFNVTWAESCATPPAAAETALAYAAGIWGGLLSSPVTIEMSACWTSTLPCSGIACGDSTTRVRNFAGAPLVDTHYPIALANSLAGSDLAPARKDITVFFDAGVDWSFATDGPPTGSIDFVSVALHEMAHGLGFTGNMYESYNVGFCGDGPFGFLYPCPTPYDWFVVDSGDIPLLDFLQPDPRDLGAKLKSDALFGGPNAATSNGGTAVKLHTPTIWQQGTSLSHLDPDGFESGENGLMTPSYGGALRSPGSVALAMMQDMGWPRAGGVPHIATTGPLAIGVGHDGSVEGALYWTGYAGEPMTYSWTVTDQDSVSHPGLGITDSLTLNWDTPGIKTVSVTATGGGISASATRTALVFDVAASGLAQGELDIAYTFNAAVTPGAAGFPVTYTWEATGLDSITHPNQGVTDAAAFTWSTPGTKTVVVTVTLNGATTQDVHTIDIGGIALDKFVFLPLVQLR